MIYDILTLLYRFSLYYSSYGPVFCVQCVYAPQRARASWSYIYDNIQYDILILSCQSMLF